MLAWILVLPSLVLDDLDLEASDSAISTILNGYALGRRNSSSAPPEPSIESVLSNEIIGHAFLQLGLAGLYQASLVSKNFRMLAYHALRPLCGCERNGKLYLDYTLILWEHDRLVQNARQGRTIAEAMEFLQGSLDYTGLKLILEAEFGNCIGFTEGSLPKVNLDPCTLDILNDERKISALPYILDQSMAMGGWLCYIRGLADLERFDLLRKMTFPRVNANQFYRLMSVLLPESVVITAARSLQKNAPKEDLGYLLDFVGPNDLPYQWPKDWELSLFTLQYLYERGVPLQECCIFYNGLHESAISFWLYVLAKEAETAKKLLDLVLRHGDDRTKILASVFYGPVTESTLACIDRDHDRAAELDMYQAMLARFRFSSICNQHVVHNYQVMLEMPRSKGYYATWAFLYCKQPHLVDLTELKSNILLLIRLMPKRTELKVMA